MSMMSVSSSSTLYEVLTRDSNDDYNDYNDYYNDDNDDNDYKFKTSSTAVKRAIPTVYPAAVYMRENPYTLRLYIYILYIYIY